MLVFVIGFFPNLIISKLTGSVAAFVDRTRPAMQEVRSPETVRATRTASAVPDADFIIAPVTLPAGPANEPVPVPTQSEAR